MALIKFKLTIAYDGTAYEGWQVQKIGTGVQENLEKALAEFFPAAPGSIARAARTRGCTRSGWWSTSRRPNRSAASRLRNCAGPQCLAAPGRARAFGGPRAGEFSRAVPAPPPSNTGISSGTRPAMNPLIRHTAWHIPRKLDLN